VINGDCKCRQPLAGLGTPEDELVAGVTGGSTTATNAAGTPVLRSIAIGVTTGLTVWFLTRFIDGSSKSRRRR
jgi:hypothetical protein